MGGKVCVSGMRFVLVGKGMGWDTVCVSRVSYRVGGKVCISGVP